MNPFNEFEKVVIRDDQVLGGHSLEVLSADNFKTKTIDKFKEDLL